MARSYANIFTAIWQEPEWRALPARAQRTYMLAVTQPNISAAGMLPLTVRRWAAMADDTKPADILEDLDVLAEARFVAVDEVTEELLVRSFVRHDNGYRNSKRVPAIRDAAGDIESRTLRRVLAGELERLGLPAGWTGEDPGGPSDSPPDRPSKANPEPTPQPAPERVDPVQAEPVDKSVDNSYPQVDSLSDRASDGISPSERVVVTKGPYIGAPTHNPQPATLPPPAARPDEPAVLDAEIIDLTPNLPALIAETENAGQITRQWIDHCVSRGLKLSGSVIKRYAAGIKRGLDEGFPPELVKRALAQMLDDRVASRPALLDSYLVRTQQGPELPPRRATRGEATAARHAPAGSNVGALIHDALTRPA